MEALRRSVASQAAKQRGLRAKGLKKKIPAQKEMLLPISGKKAAASEERKPAARKLRAKAG